MFPGLIFLAFVQSGGGRLDPYGDPLPPGVMARIGSCRTSESFVWWGAITPNGATCVQSGPFDDLIVRDAVSQKARFIARLGADESLGVGLSQDGRKLTTVISKKDRDRSWEESTFYAVVWDTIASKKLVNIRIGAGRISPGPIAFSNDGKRVAVFHSGFHVIDLDRGEVAQRIKVGTNEMFYRVAFSADDRYMIAIGVERVAIWEVATGKSLDLSGLPVSLFHDSSMIAMTGKFLTAVGPGYAARYEITWPTEGRPIAFGKPVKISSNHIEVGAIWPSQDGSMAIVSREGGQIEVFDFPAKKVSIGKDLGGFRVFAVAFPESGPRLLCKSRDASPPKSLELIDLKTGENLTRAAGVRFAAGNPEWLADGKHLQVGHDIWNSMTGQFIKRVPARLDAPESAWVAPDRRRFLMSADRRIALVEVGGEMRIVGGHGRVVYSRGSTVQGVEIWDVAANVKTGQLVVEESRISALAGRHEPVRLSDDGRMAVSRAVGKDNSVDVWDTMTGTRRHCIDVGQQVGTLLLCRLAADGRRLAVAGDRGAALYDMRTGRTVGVAQIAYPKNRPSRLDFSADGRILVVGSVEEGFSRTNAPKRLSWIDVIDIRRGLRLFTRCTYQTDLREMSLSPSASKIFTLGEGGGIHVWAVPLKPSALPFTAREISDAWRDFDLGNLDRWVATGVPAVTFLSRHLIPLERDADRMTEAAIQRLGSDQFNERQAAEEWLRGLGRDALPVLRRAQARVKDPEILQRIESILNADAFPLSPATARNLIAVEILERIGTSDALLRLTRLADGAKGEPVADEARAAIRRMRSGHDG